MSLTCFQIENILEELHNYSPSPEYPAACRNKAKIPLAGLQGASFEDVPISLRFPIQSGVMPAKETLDALLLLCAGVPLLAPDL